MRHILKPLLVCATLLLLAGCPAPEPAEPVSEETEENWVQRAKEEAENAPPAEPEPEVFRGSDVIGDGITVSIEAMGEYIPGKNLFSVKVEVKAPEGVKCEGAFEVPGTPFTYEELVGDEVGGVFGDSVDRADPAQKDTRIRIRCTFPDGRVRVLLFPDF